jgi:aconitate hydratase 2 / 2-methylisocitrate dehydratase
MLRNISKFRSSLLNTKKTFCNISSFKKTLDEHKEERLKLGLESEVLSYNLTEELIKELKNPYDNEGAFLLYQFKYRISPGVDNISRLKAKFLYNIAIKNEHSPLIDANEATKILGTMQGGYSCEALIRLLDTDQVKNASQELKNMILLFDNFYRVEEKYKKGNIYAKNILESWANMDWLNKRRILKEKITLNVFKVNGEINTDDLSPATDTWSRPDIPLHSLSMLKMPRKGLIPDKPGEIGPLEKIKWMKQRDYPIAFVGDIVGTGPSRKSAINSILWHFGDLILYVPNKKTGGFCFGGKIAPIFFNTMEDSGALPIEMPVENINMDQLIDIYPYEGKTRDHYSNELICEWELKSPELLKSVQAGGRINLIIGKSLANKSLESLTSNKESKNIPIKFLGTTESHLNPIKREYNELYFTKKNFKPKKNINEKILGASESHCYPKKPNNIKIKNNNLDNKIL